MDLTITVQLVIVFTAHALGGCHAQVIGFDPSNYTVKESDRTLLVTAMVLEGYVPHGENVTLTVSTKAGTAIGGKDYKPIKDEILVFDNETVIQAINVTIFEDNIQELHEEFFLVLTEPQRIFKRTIFQLNTPIASIFINDTSPEVDHALAIGVGVGIPLLFLIIGIAIAIVIFQKYWKKNRKSKSVEHGQEEHELK